MEPFPAYPETGHTQFFDNFGTFSIANDLTSTVKIYEKAQDANHSNMAAEPKSTPCELISTYYQTCNHVTVSLHHATRIIPSKSSDPKSSATSTTPGQIITTCPQVIHNLSLPPPLNQRQKSDTALCPSILNRTLINSGYGCPDCEPEYHQSIDYTTTGPGRQGEKIVDEEKIKKKRLEWCMLAITEWEARKEAALGDGPSGKTVG
ncbi:uncharacterized protein EAF01_009817 [Botrytis porri]|uniref:Uncharacterized protein n=1 Tax=Botrytis porri TaxID=87229 RepID=A0A4Z1KI77_9HELO|nr:uncharacterized protein EAF01_009817 [Botrytis porri]KAF7894366.1 hypothetical protein EAF01_009817 [Botrytis porri]TGO85793.1 hypothetical protein BPOR_0363g00110 [Botrytis porri]